MKRSPNQQTARTIHRGLTPCGSDGTSNRGLTPVGSDNSHCNAPRKRGTILILVVVMLALMALMGTAYLQISRVTREATKDVGGDIDVVADSVVQMLFQQTAEDVFPASGDQFDQAGGAGKTVEPFDYPGNAANWGGTQGEFDDLWLASTAPVDGGLNNDSWPHITNLTQKYVTGWNNATVKFGAASPTDAAMTTTQDTNQLYSDPQLVDASGDGVGDSRWFFPPIKAIRGIEYVAALYVVDNSSKLNANVALSQVNSGGTYSYSGAGGAANAPQWWYPVELDLGRFARSINNSGGAMTQLTNMLRWRMGSGSATVLPSPWYTNAGDPLVRSHFWFNGARTWGNYNSGTPASNYRHFTDTDEMELRFGNGLNTATQTQIENTTEGVPTLLRHTVTAETSWSTVTGMATLADWYKLDARKQLTVFNGSAVFAPRLPGDPAGRVLKADLNRLATQANKGQLAAEVLKIINAGSSPMALPSGFTTAADYANQIAANIIDYVDNDVPTDPDATLARIGGNTLTKVGNRWGFEGLPFIAEVYVQRQYTSRIIAPANTDVIWEAQPSAANNKAGFAIEIRNPLAHQIDLRNITLLVDGASWGTLDTLVPASFGRVYLNSYEGIILYRASTPDDGTRNDVTPLFATGANIIAAANQLVINTANDWPTTDGAINVELRVKDTTGDDVRYQVVPSWGMTAATAPIVIASGTPVANGVVRYRQYATVGNGNKLNVLAVTDPGSAGTGRKFTPIDYNPLTDSATGTAYQGTNAERLGQDNKTNTLDGHAGPADILTTTNNEQIVISNFGQFGQVGELAHVAFIGPRDTGSGANSAEPLPERWGNQTTAAAFMLNFTLTANKVNATVDALNVTHAAMFFDRFTTMAPTVSFTGDVGDGRDNDGDGQTDEADEQLVPGMININTVTDVLLTKVLPIADSTLRGQTIAAILDYRDNPAGRTAGSRANPGIANMGELYDRLQTALTSGSPGDTSMVGGVWVDMIGQNMSPNGTADGVIDDREEQAMFARFMNQVASTRSDIFTAYIVVHGYQSGAFNQDPIEAARYIVVFDRSGMTSNSDRPRVIGYQRVN